MSDPLAALDRLRAGARILNTESAPDEAVSLDVLAPIRQLLVDAANAAPGGTLSSLLPVGETANRPIYCGGMEYALGEGQSAILLIESDMATSYNECIATNYVRMLCFGGGAADEPYEASSMLRDAAVAVLRPVAKEQVLGKVIHSIGIGSDRSRLDPGTGRPYIDIELTVVSDIRRFTE